MPVPACQALSDRMRPWLDRALGALVTAGEESTDAVRSAGRQAAILAHGARAQARRVMDEYPVESIAAVAGAAFLAGAWLRVWRSHRHA